MSIIEDLAKQTWPSAYGDILSYQQIDYMLEKMYNRGELSHQLAEGHVFLIAEENGNDIGFAGYSLIDSVQKIYKLHKLYVLPQQQGKSIGKLLLLEVLGAVGRNSGKVLQLNVNRNNKALSFYQKQGFSILETVDLDIGNGYFMNDYVMEKKL